MQFLKGLAISLLSLLLFLSLSIFGLAFMLNQTILNPDFMVAELNKLDISSLIKESVIKEIGPQISQQIPQGEEAIMGVLNDTVDDLDPWIKERTSEAAYSIYDYFNGRSDTLSLTIPLEPVKDSLKDNLRETILQSPPPELAGIPQEVRQQIIDSINQQITQELPENFDFSESSLPPEAQCTLEQVRQGISYFRLGYQALIGFILLLIIGIVLLYLQVKGATRSLGITFLTAGAFMYVDILVAKYFSAKYFAGTLFSQSGLPPSIQAWLPQFLIDLLAPLEIVSICFAVAGAVLIIVSIIYKREPSFQI